MFIKRDEKELIEANFREAFLDFANHVESRHGVTWLTSRVPFPNFNCVMQTNAKESDIEQTIEEVIQFYQGREIPFVWFVTELSTPVSLPYYLEKKGFKAFPAYQGMILDLKSSFASFTPAKGICLKQISDVAALAKWVLPIEQSYKFTSGVTICFTEMMQKMMQQEKIIHYAAYVKEKLAGSASAFLGSKSLGLYNLAVYPELRKKQVGTALQYARIELARTLGFRYVVLQADEFSAKAALSLGFNSVMSFVPYVISDKAPNS